VVGGEGRGQSPALENVNVVKATRRYEEWLGRHTRLLPRDLEFKHQEMAVAAFPFLRATFYRWMQVWPEICSPFDRAPRVLAVGDLHVENFGTWRDVEGRLVWGVNDFDEAAVLPYTLDLVRLATSVVVAAEEGHLAIKAKEAAEAILEGYGKSLAEGGRPFVLEEEHSWLREIATSELRDPVSFWRKMDSLPKMKDVPAGAHAAIEHLLPERGLGYRTVRRVAGLGSLGHIRVVALAECHGGRIAREAKALAPSAADWAADVEGPEEILYHAIIGNAVRCADPFVRLCGPWIVRRLSPHCSRIELSELPKHHDELRLLFAMGWETANIHLGTQSAGREVERHLRKLKANWLSDAAKQMSDAVTRDWRDWKASFSD